MARINPYRMPKDKKDAARLARQTLAAQAAASNPMINYYRNLAASAPGEQMVADTIGGYFSDALRMAGGNAGGTYAGLGDVLSAFGGAGSDVGSYLTSTGANLTEMADPLKRAMATDVAGLVQAGVGAGKKQQLAAKENIAKLQSEKKSTMANWLPTFSSLLSLLKSAGGGYGSGGSSAAATGGGNLGKTNLFGQRKFEGDVTLPSGYYFQDTSATALDAPNYYAPTSGGTASYKPPKIGPRGSNR